LGITVVFTHTRRRWAFVRGLLAAGWREHGVLGCLFLFFYLFFCRHHNNSLFFVVVKTAFY
jgi:hypothetical protein